MKIAYVVAEGLNKEHGVSKKILNQISSWESNGHQVKLFYFSNKPISSIFKNTEYQIVKFKNRIDFVFNPKHYAGIQEWSPDVIYFRKYLYSRTFSRMLKDFPGVLEINSNDIEQSKLTFPLIIRMFNLFTRRYILNKAAGLVCVTNELNEQFKKNNRNIITIPNGIDGSFKGKIENNNNNRPQVLFLGSANQPWHGLDKVELMAEKLSEIDFHVIGTQELKSTTRNLKQYGYMSEEEYLYILNKCDVAVGTLALHRKNMSEACPLKTREYLKYGLPIIIGYRDSDFCEGKYDFILELPNVEENVINNINTIKEFIEKSMTNRVEKSEIQHVFNNSKEKVRLDFFNEIVRR